MRLQEADCLAPTLAAGMQRGAAHPHKTTDLPTEVVLTWSYSRVTGQWELSGPLQQF